MRKISKWLCLILMLVSLTISLVPAPAAAQETEEIWTTGQRFNIMLVIDGSGSLISAETTDPTGMRYELLTDLMGILEDDGHRLGAVVFSGNKGTNASDEAMQSGIRLKTDMLYVDEPAPDGGLVKDYISKMIIKADVDRSDRCRTDVGTALLVAERELQKAQKENGLPSLVFLFTDGVTDVSHPPVAEKASENLQTATREMSQNGIRLFGAFLNKDGKIQSSEIADMVCAANSITRTSEQFANSYVELTDMDKCHEAVNVLMRFLGYTLVDDDFVFVGRMDDDFVVPGIGVEEINIRLYTSDGQDLPRMNVILTQPDGSQITGSAVDNISRSSRTIRTIKIQKPMAGQWHLRVEVVGNTTIRCSYGKIYSMKISSDLTVSPEVSQLLVNGKATFTGILSRDGKVASDVLSYAGYTARLEIKDSMTNEITPYDMDPAGTSFVKEMTLSEYGDYEARVVFTCDGIEVPSAFVPYSLQNHAPEISNPNPQKIKYGPMQEKTTEMDLSLYYKDAEDGKNLNLTLARTDCNEAGFSLNGSKLTITNAEIGEGSIVFLVTDSQGAGGEMVVKVSSKNVLPIFIALCVGSLLALIVVLLVIIRSINGMKVEGELSVTFRNLRVGDQNSFSMELPMPGSGAAKRVTLKTLVDRILKYETTRVNGLTAAMIKDALSSYRDSLDQITLRQVIRFKKGKLVAGLQVRHEKESCILTDENEMAIDLGEIGVSLNYTAPESVEEEDDFFGNDGREEKRRESRRDRKRKRRYEDEDEDSF